MGKIEMPVLIGERANKITYTGAENKRPVYVQIFLTREQNERLQKMFPLDDEKEE